MNTTNMSSKQDLIEKIAALDESGFFVTDGVANFSTQFYARAPLEELSATQAQTLAGLANNLARFVAKRPAGAPLLRVYNPELERDGWESRHTIIEMVNDDMPFLVDSASMVLTELNIGIHRIIHPILSSRRDASGQLVELLSKGDDSGHPESVIHIQIDRQAVPAVFDRIRDRLTQSLGDVQRAVKDWAVMRQRAVELAQQLPEMAAPCGSEQVVETQAFLRWLADDHFTFLGYCKYHIKETSDAREISREDGSELGIMHAPSPAQARRLDSLSVGAREREAQRDAVIITKTNARSTVHRSGYMDYVSVLEYNPAGQVVVEHRFLGLFTSGAYSRSARDIPLARRKVSSVVERAGLRPRSHEGKALVHILETLPRDEIFQSSVDELYDLAMGILDLQERPQTRLFVRREMFGRFYSCLVYLPRDRFNTENREKIQATLKRALKAERLDHTVHVADSNLARLHVILRLKSGVEPSFDVRELEQKILTIVRSWHDALKETLVERFGELEGLRLSEQYGKAFPVAYMDDVTPWVASFDVEKVAALGEHADDLQMSLYRPKRKVADPNMLRFKLFRRHQPLDLSRILPMLESLGLKILSERPYSLNLGAGRSISVQDLDMLPAMSGAIDLEAVEQDFQECFRRIAAGAAESDDLNRLVLGAQLNWRQVGMLRAYCRYLQQTSLPLSKTYMEQTLSRNPLLARLLVLQFELLFAPSEAALAQVNHQARRSLTWLQQQFASYADGIAQLLGALGESVDAALQALKDLLNQSLDDIKSQDEDRILRAFDGVIRATLRTNYFQALAGISLLPASADPVDDFLCFKLNSSQVPELPKPRPYREIWVYSPRVEGIHLRMGPVARGGLRWSDRREDFRTEILDLIKAQNVKNTLIVPVGAKGGFVLKQAPTDGTRESLMKEGIYCYRTFITALLSITDNRREDLLLPPPEVVRRDGDDPYLVVAADKGTASFSDIANTVAQNHGFWLDDAFASGGSNGYDHKGMGITAKGAWECVKRHFREIGIDTQSTDFTVVGIGDMAGDVFGNGMLLSPHIRLQAAFNHMHIFLDPDPDAASSFVERQRLFNLPRSTWEDYNRELISKGGGIYSRQSKYIELTPEVRAWLGTSAERLSPQELIRQLLMAPVDLLWNGGIGTYVKASTETHADAADRSNDALRVNANQLRCKVVGEGGNLGMTQKSRIEYGLRGGRLNTDFIDNSAGVDCSDHEVNIKILLSLAEDLSLEDRNQLLREMQDEVEVLVLRSNYLQSQAISQMQVQAHTRMGALGHLIATLEHRNILDREVEGLPDNEALRERMARGEPLTRPELSLLLSYGKIFAYQELLDSDVPEDPYLTRELVSYFPTQLRERYRGLMDGHPLKREIIATMVTNSMVNRMGASFALRVQEDTGADIASVAKAYTIAREVFAAREFWKQVETLDNQVHADFQIEAQLRMWDLVRHATRWFLNLPGAALDIEAMVARYANGIYELRDAAQALLPELERQQVRDLTARFRAAGFPEVLAEQVAALHLLTYALDVVEEAAQRGLPIRQVLEAYFAVDRELDLAWLRAKVEELPTSGHWDANARGHLRTDLQQQHRALTGLALANYSDGLQHWLNAHGERIQRTRALIDEMRSQGVVDFPSMTVAIRSLAQLVNAGSGAANRVAA